MTASKRLSPPLILLGVFLLMGCTSTNTKLQVIHTVQGPIPADSLGTTLSHEHLFSNFGLPITQTNTYNESQLYEQVIPYLRKLHDQGIRTIVDYTAVSFGRRPDLLKHISDSTGIHILTNTGIYGAADDRYVPSYAFKSTAEELAGNWIEEAVKGIGETGIRPGFVKLAFDEGAPSEIDRKLFEAALLTHLETGLTVAVHTGSNPEAVRLQLALLEEYGIDPSAWIWTHANWHDDLDFILEVAEKGAWISLDGVKADNLEQYMEYIDRFSEAGLLHRLLLSHDGDAYPAGGAIRPFHAITEQLIPAMREKGFSESTIDQLLVESPAQAYSIGVRTAEDGVN